MGVAPHDDLPGRHPVRRMDSEGDDLFRIGNQSHRRVPPPNQIGHGRGVGSVGDDDLDRTLVVLGQHRVDRRPDGCLGVPSRDENSTPTASGSPGSTAGREQDSPSCSVTSIVSVRLPSAAFSVPFFRLPISSDTRPGQAEPRKRRPRTSARRSEVVFPSQRKAEVVLRLLLLRGADLDLLSPEPEITPSTLPERWTTFLPAGQVFSAGLAGLKTRRFDGREEEVRGLAVRG